MPSEEYKKWFRQERKDYQESYDSSQKRLDEILLLVTIPALGWFISCLKDIGYPFNFFTQCLMWFVIGGFTSVILLNATSLWASFISARKMIKNLEDDYKNTEQTATVKDIYHFARWSKITKYLNYAAYIVFATACISLAIFIIAVTNFKLNH